MSTMEPAGETFSEDVRGEPLSSLTGVNELWLQSLRKQISILADRLASRGVSPDEIEKFVRDALSETEETNQVASSPQSEMLGAIVDIRLVPEHSTPGERVGDALNDERVIAVAEELHATLSGEEFGLSRDEELTVADRIIRRIIDGSQRPKGLRFKQGQDGEA